MLIIQRKMAKKRFFLQRTETFFIPGHDLPVKMYQGPQMTQTANGKGLLMTDLKGKEV